MPAFFNMLVAISDNGKLMQDLGDDSLLKKFVQLSMYFNPMMQIDKKSSFSIKVVDAEKIFLELNSGFNPYNEHQDCQEFLSITLDLLHDELKLIYVRPEEDSKGHVDEWQETGARGDKMHFNND